MTASPQVDAKGLDFNAFFQGLAGILVPKVSLTLLSLISAFGKTAKIKRCNIPFLA